MTRLGACCLIGETYRSPKLSAGMAGTHKSRLTNCRHWLVDVQVSKFTFLSLGNGILWSSHQDIDENIRVLIFAAIKLTVPVLLLH